MCAMYGVHCTHWEHEAWQIKSINTRVKCAAQRTKRNDGITISELKWCNKGTSNLFMMTLRKQMCEIGTQIIFSLRGFFVN